MADNSGNNNDGDPVDGAVPADPTDNPVISGNPGTCGYGDIPNNSADTIDAVDTNFTPGNQGSITFWYNSNESWDATDRIIFDASNDLGNDGADKQFFLVKRRQGTGKLKFKAEDTADTDLKAQTGNLGFGANTWVHIAVTWDLPNDFLEIYVNGTSQATDNTNTNGTVGTLNDLYISDNRTTGIGGDQWASNSANGFIDEFKIYNGVITASQVAADFIGNT